MKIAWLALYPGLRFKLDAEPEWTPELVAGLAATGAVDVVDLKGHYRGDFTGPAADPALYRLVDEAEETGFSKTDWVIVTRDRALVDNAAIAGKASEVDAIPGLRPWTDDFNNLFQILK